MFRIFPALLISLFAATSVADVTVIESFENTADPAVWTGSMEPGQTHNAVSLPSEVPVFVSSDVTEGALAGKFSATWSSAPASAASNPYISTDPTNYWAVRYNILAPGSLPTNILPSADSVLEADIKNNSNHSISVALVVDNAGSSQLERGPLVAVAAGTSATYTWNFATTPPTGFVTGDGVFSGDTQRVKSLLVYTLDPAASGSQLNVTVDNIRNISSPDLTPPAAPRIKAVKQGAGAGNVIVRWAASADADVASYKVYLSSDSEFNNPVVNRLQFPAMPVATVGAAELETVLNGQPVNQNIYVAVSAVDNSPAANESPLSQAFAVNLKSDGSQPLDRIVMDQDRYLPGNSNFESEGYFHAAVYTAQALGALNRTFDSISDEALALSEEVLTPSENGVVHWSNLKDGDGNSAEALTAASLVKITALVNADGNIIISGSGVAEALIGMPALGTALKATLQTGNIGIASVSPAANILPDVPGLSTSQNPAINTVAFATTSNDGILPAVGSTNAAEYTGIPANTAVAGIGYEESLLFLGFAYESVGSPGGSTASKLLRQQLMIGMLRYLTGQTAANDWQLFD